MVIDALERGGLLRSGLNRDDARAILWTLTSREIFRMLVRERGWTGDQYEAWLREVIRWELTGK
jgi:hypothetical protein